MSKKKRVEIPETKRILPKTPNRAHTEMATEKSDMQWENNRAENHKR